MFLYKWQSLFCILQRKKSFVRVKRIEDDESDDEGKTGGGERDAIANELFEG